MPLLDKILRRHSQAESPNPTDNKTQEEGTAPALEEPVPATSAPDTTKSPLPQDVIRAGPNYQSTGQNAGMAAGAVTGALGPGSVGGDMVAGGVVGGVIGQRVTQAQNHAFYKEQSLKYREGRADGSIPPPEELYQGEKPSWWSREGRAQRRAERWEKRASRASRQGD